MPKVCDWISCVGPYTQLGCQPEPSSHKITHHQAPLLVDLLSPSLSLGASSKFIGRLMADFCQIQ
jgi:hypothetical protein